MNKSKSRIIFGLLIIAFFGPMIAAGFLYKTAGDWHMGTTNKGTLLQPPLNFNQLSLKNMATGESFINHENEWRLVYFAPSNCRADCQNMLYVMRQVRIALGKDQNRIVRVVVTTATPDSAFINLLNKNYLGTQQAMISVATLESFLPKNLATPVALQQSSLYLVDPLGNMMMVYKNNINPEDLLKDLTRLLNVSQIG